MFLGDLDCSDSFVAVVFEVVVAEVGLKAVFLGTLKYGFCNKSFQKDEPLTS